MPSIDAVLPPEEEASIEESPPTASGPVIGIIYPPPEVRSTLCLESASYVMDVLWKLRYFTKLVVRVNSCVGTPAGTLIHFRYIYNDGCQRMSKLEKYLYDIVDKTAAFVARNGPEFESRIRQNELGNAKFNFLNSGDPYHAYYQHKVKDIREGKAVDINSGGPPISSSIGASLAGATGALGRLAVTPAAAARQQELLKAAAPAEAPPPRDPPPDFEFLADPPSISALDLDIVKLTAQFVARNGRQFLTDLMNREQRNYQFDFLRPQHSLFQYFTRLLEQYTKVLLPPKELVSRLAAEIRGGVLEQARSRAAWHAHQARKRAQDEARVEKERIAYAAIDWHDFVVVETVDYPAGEPGDFPPPTTPLEVGARVLAQERGEDITHNAAGDDDDTEMQLESDSESSSDDEEGLATMEDRTAERQPSRPDDNRVQDMEEESSASEDEKEPEREKEPTPLPPRPDRVVVKKYDPKKRPAPSAQPADEWLVSPITGEKIPAHKVAEHVRIGLLDPRWLEQRDKAAAERTDRDEALAPGAAIEASLKQLAERRTDIFGVGDEETAIGKKIGEEEKKRDDRVTWDGHTSSVEAATRAARAHITLEDQIHQIHKVKGLLPDEEKEKIGPKPAMGSSRSAPPPARPPPPPPMSRPVPPPAAPPPTPVLLPPMPPLMVMPLAPRPPLMAAPVPPAFGFPPAAPPVPAPVLIEDDEPAAKRARTEDSLEPERAWLGKHGAAPVALQVALPHAPERSEWRLDGRLLPFTMSLGTSVVELKNQIHRVTNMPQAKQKVNYDGLFLKDSNTLAFYNVPPGAVLQLQVKERGGRKK